MIDDFQLMDVRFINWQSAIVNLQSAICNHQ